MFARAARLADGTALMSERAVQDLRDHAVETYPEECVGVVLADGSYRRHDNAAPDRAKGALLRGQVVLELLEAGQLRAICHSHPDGPDCPSAGDMAAQIEQMVPFVLVSTNGQATTDPFAWGDELIREQSIEELIGRPFRHGVTDCYALVRDYFRLERATLLPEYPRDWSWWLKGGDLYRRYFAEAGFHEIAPEEVRPGDGWLAAVRSEVPNHAGLVLDDGLCLHHPSSGLAYDPSRLSKREPMARWVQYVTHWLRR